MKESMWLNRPFAVVADCINVMCSYISRVVHISLHSKEQKSCLFFPAHQYGLGQAIFCDVTLQISRQLQGHRTYFFPTGAFLIGWNQRGENIKNKKLKAFHCIKERWPLPLTTEEERNLEKVQCKLNPTRFKKCTFTLNENLLRLITD